MSPVSTSTAFRNAIFARQTGEAAIVLCDIAHDDFAETLHVCHNGENITSNGVEYTATAFDLVLPNQTEDSPPQARLAICNVDREIVNSIRGLSTSPDFTFSVVLASDPDTVERTFPAMQLSEVSYDALVVEGTLGFEDFLGEPYPGDVFSPVTTPGLFGATA